MSVKWKVNSILLLLAVVAGSASTFVKVRDGLVQQRAAMATEWGHVEEALDDRAANIRRLAEAARGRGAGASPLADDVIKASTEVANLHTPETKLSANDRLSNLLAKLLLAGETHPKIGTDRNFRIFEEEIKNSEDRVADARLKYNDSLEHYNARIQSFPYNLVARISGFQRNDAYFQTERF